MLQFSILGNGALLTNGASARSGRAHDYVVEDDDVTGFEHQSILKPRYEFRSVRERLAAMAAAAAAEGEDGRCEGIRERMEEALMGEEGSIYTLFIEVLVDFFSFKQNKELLNFGLDLELPLGRLLGLPGPGRT